MLKYIKEFKFSFPILLDENAKVANAYGVWSHPTTFFINRKGKIVGRVIGGRDWMSESMSVLIQHLLGERK